MGLIEADGRVRLSPSRIKLLNECPLAYQMKYDDRLTAWVAEQFPLSDDAGPAAERGRIVHSVLEAVGRRWLTDGPFEVTYAVLSDELKAQALIYRTIKPAVLRESRRIIKRLSKSLDMKNLARVEYPLTLETMRWVTRLRIDRLDRPEDDEVLVIDYKTGGWIPSREDNEDDPQTILYLATLRQLFPEARPPRLLYWFIDRDITVQSRWSRELHENALFLADTAAALVLQLDAAFTRDGSAFPATAGKHCSRCPFRSRCDAFQSYARAHPELVVAPESATIEELCAVRKTAVSTRDFAEAIRKDTDARLRPVLDELAAAGKRCKVGSYRAWSTARRSRRSYPNLWSTARLLSGMLGRPLQEVLAGIAGVSSKRLDAYLDENVLAEDRKHVEEELERTGDQSWSTTVYVREVGVGKAEEEDDAIEG